MPWVTDEHPPRLIWAVALLHGKEDGSRFPVGSSCLLCGISLLFLHSLPFCLAALSVSHPESVGPVVG